MPSPLAAYAAQVAPELDRLRLAVMHAAVAEGMSSGVLAEAGLDPETLSVFAMLRNAYPDRAVPVRCFGAAYVYQPTERFTTALTRMGDRRLVDADVLDDGSDSVRLTPLGRDLMSQVRAFSARAAEGLWGTGSIPLLPLTDRCLDSAATSARPDGAFHVVAPPHDEPEDSDATRLAERLTGLRWHRFDAHVAAWQAAGLTSRTVADLAPGPDRDRIEATTNEWAGQPYDVLSADEREVLLEGLRSLRA